jgi:coatomer subunit alpha
VSASDDQTVRIWNWQSRTCLGILTGHSHYVMCARFHPSEDLVVSASLDQTLRVWDVGPIRRKNVRGSGGVPPPTLPGASPLATLRAQAERLAGNAVRPGGAGATPTVGGEAGSEAVVKYILDTHDRGVNWASFHPTMPLIVSAADDRTVKIWRMGDVRAWDVDTLRGHSTNVSCVLFHPHADLIVSNSEDRSIRVWDATKRIQLQVYRRDSDRFWVLAAHPLQNLLAAGHDSGLVVFKLERERPAFCSAGPGLLFYSSDRDVRRCVLGAASDTKLYTERRASTSYQFNAGPRTLSFNHHAPAAESVLWHTLAEGGNWKILDVSMLGNAAAAGRVVEPLSGGGLSVCFLTRTRFVVLDRDRRLSIKDMDGQTVKTVSLPPGYDRADTIFAASTSGRILIRSEDRVCLFETASLRVIGEISGLRRVRYVAWSPDGTMVALVTRLTVTLADRELRHLATVREGVRVKSACWDENGILFFNTYTHLKYLVPEVAVRGASGDAPALVLSSTVSGGADDGEGGSAAAEVKDDSVAVAAATAADSKAAEDAAARTSDAIGIIRSLPAVVYLVEARDGSLYVLDRKRQVKSLSYDPTEPRFKRSLALKQYADVVKLIRGGSMCGQAVLSYLQRAGYPEIAMHFVRDTATKFGLALECGDLGTAKTCAEAMGETDLWLRLAQEAIVRGDVTTAELSLQQARSRDKLSFLYTITGDRSKLRRMLGIAQKVKDPMGRFQTALALGDAAERVAVLESTGQLALAFASARVFGLEEDAERLHGLMESNGIPVPDMEQLLEQMPQIGTCACVPLPPVAPVAGSWPQVAARKSVFDSEVLSGNADISNEEVAPLGAASSKSAWVDDDDLGLDDNVGQPSAAVAALQESKPAVPSGAGGGGWGIDDDELDLGDDDMDLPPPPAAPVVQAQAASSEWAPPTAGPGFSSRWVVGSSLAAEHAASGSFDSAADLLRRQLGLATLAPLREQFLAARQGCSVAVPTIPGLPCVVAPVGIDASASRPAVPVTVASLSADMASVFRAFQAGDFSGTAAGCDAIFQRLPLCVARSKAEEKEVAQVLEAAREYKTAVLIESARKALNPEEDPKRVLELAAYLTHCRLQPAHKILALDLAMSISFKLRNFASATQFANRLIETPQATGPAFAPRVAKAQKVVAKAQTQGRNQVSIEYDPRTPFDVCCASLTAIPRGSPSVASPFSGARYRPEYSGEVCRVDNCATIGEETTGLVTLSAADQSADVGASASSAATSW